MFREISLDWESLFRCALLVPGNCVSEFGAWHIRRLSLDCRGKPRWLRPVHFRPLARCLTDLPRNWDAEQTDQQQKQSMTQRSRFDIFAIGLLVMVKHLEYLVSAAFR